VPKKTEIPYTYFYQLFYDRWSCGCGSHRVT